MKKWGKHIAAFVVLVSLLPTGRFLHAADATEQEITRLKDEVTQREARQQQINDKIQEYDRQIQKKQSEVSGLKDEVGVLENAAAKTQLEIDQTNLELQTTDQQIRVIDLEIGEQTASLEKKKKSLKELIRSLARERHMSPLQIVFGSKTFSDMLDDLQRLQTVHKTLSSALTDTKTTRTALEQKRSSKDDKRTALKTLQDSLVTKQALLKDQQGSKQLLISQTNSSEENYRALVQSLKDEQEYLDQELAGLQKAIDQKITDADVLGNSSLLTYPVEDYVITTLFHDPTYPFRYLFEHSGLDLAARQGTPVGSAAPGYVAVARTGKMYGNYVMVVHGNGIATLYAHLSKISVSVDQFVGRGQLIGLVGTTGFSTGPHLHFEVRVDGIPVDPLGYLISK